MAKGKVLVERVRRGAKDQDISTEEILQKLNDALLEIAGEVLLPRLQTSDTVTTVEDAAVADLPDDFHRNLFRVEDPADLSRDITIRNNRAHMERVWGRFDYDGVVSDVCVDGDDKLLYAKIPAAATDLTIHYYRTPTTITLVTESDAFNAVQRVKGEKAMVSWVVWQIKQDMEQGVDGAKVNTKYFEEKYNQDLNRLEAVTREGAAYKPMPIVRGDFL